MPKSKLPSRGRKNSSSCLKCPTTPNPTTDHEMPSECEDSAKEKVHRDVSRRETAPIRRSRRRTRENNEEGRSSDEDQTARKRVRFCVCLSVFDGSVLKFNVTDISALVVTRQLYFISFLFNS